MSPKMGDELALALALEGRGTAARQVKDLVALSERLAELPEPEIDPAFVAALEARLLSEGLEEAPAGRPRLAVVPEPARRTAPEPVEPNVVRMPRRRLALRRSAVAAATAAMLAAFPIAAAATAVPDSPFYFGKRLIERAQLAVFGTPVEDAFTMMRFAERRIDEAAQVTVLGGNASGLLGEAEATTRSASGLLLGATQDPATLERFAGRLDHTAGKMDSLRPVVAPEAEGALQSAIDATRAAQAAVNGQLPPVAGVSPAGPVSVDGTGVPAVSSQAGTQSGQSGPKANAGSSSESAKTQGSSSSGDGVTDATRDARDTTAKNSEDAGRYCYVPGSANGFGDLGAPLTRVLCG